MAYEWVDMGELAVRVVGSEGTSLKPYIGGDLGNLSTEFFSDPGNLHFHSGRAGSGTEYSLIVSATNGNYDLMPILDSVSAETQIEIYNPKIGINTGFRMYIKPNLGQLFFGHVLYGSVTWYNMQSYAFNVSNRHIYLSFAIDETNGKGIACLWTRSFWDEPYGSEIRHYASYDCMGPGSNNQNICSIIVQSLYQGNEPGPGPSPDDPYGDDDYTNSSGGDGDHDDTSDTISQDAIPIAAATRTGMCTAYVPNWGEIRDVATALLNPNWAQLLMSNIVKFSDVIIGLSVFPCTIPATYTGTVKGNVIGFEIGTGVISHIADDQYVEINCGDLTVEEYWGNCLDYNPYTKISIFLPFCGTYELDADEIMGRTLNVSYRIDIMSGACLATIKIDGSVFYQYSGQCSAQIPLSSVSFDQFLSSMINLGVATATGVGAICAAGAGVKEAETAFKAAGSSGSGGSALMEAREHLSSVKTQSANSIADATVGAVMGSKGFYTHAGAMSGSPGFLGVRTPYLTIKRPEQLIPSMYGKFHGYPCNTTAVLGDLVGYTEIGDIRLNIPDATVEEILECEQLLKGGVVI